jgi:RNA polymerase sigma factor (sigma-70 family)
VRLRGPVRLHSPTRSIRDTATFGARRHSVGDRFQTTQWSVVIRARDASPSVSREALSRLCEAYWEPVYGFIRRSTRDGEGARDLTQGFFVRVVEDGFLKNVSQDEGRFRSFMLGAVRHFMADERDRERAIKRGGGTFQISFDGVEADERQRIEPVAEETPELAFERRWAKTVLDRAMKRLEATALADGKKDEFVAMRPYLSDSDPAMGYGELAFRLGSTEGAVKVAVHRLRRRFGTCVRDEIAETVSDAAEVDREVRYLMSIVAP